MTKQQVKEKIFKIADMKEFELEYFSQKLFIAKEGMSKETFETLLGAVDLQRERLSKMGIDETMAVCSELTSGEIGL